MQCIYLHGFNSSPQAVKSLLLRDALSKQSPAVNFIAPDLQLSPNDAISLLSEKIVVQPGENTLLVGSSLGGFYAIYLAERFGCKAALINPAVRAHQGVAAYFGEHINPHTGEKFSVTPEHALQLQKLYVETIINPANYLLLLQTGDDVIDYRQTLEKFPDSPCIIQKGGSHRFDNFVDIVGDIFTFAGIREA